MLKPAGSIHDYAANDRRSVSAQLRGQGDRREAGYARLLERRLKRCPETDPSVLAQEFEQRCYRREWGKRWLQSAKRLPIVGAAFNLHALLFFVAGGGLGWLLGLP